MGNTHTYRQWCLFQPSADNLEAQFQAVDEPSDPAFTEMVDVAMRSYEYAPASEPTLTAPSEVLQAIRRLKICKASGPDGIQNGVLRHLSKRAMDDRCYESV
jgi:hypothetical protein